VQGNIMPWRNLATRQWNAFTTSVLRQGHKDREPERQSWTDSDRQSWRKWHHKQNYMPIRFSRIRENEKERERDAKFGDHQADAECEARATKKLTVLPDLSRKKTR
jgi:hypothetical protein